MTTTAKVPPSPSSRPRWRALVPLRHLAYRLHGGTVALSVFATGMWTIVISRLS